jgi:serine/threonine-protein kinase GIN4
MNLNIVENEITALSLTRSHPSIVNLYEVFYERGETILILEYATEKDLHIYLDCEGAFEEEKACHILYQVLKAIEFLHSKNILHLDIKPENVLLMNPLSPTSLKDENKPENEANLLEKSTAEDPSNIKVKLCDFSFSQIMISGKQILGMMGTVAYSAPEVLQYEPLTKATDMWSLGVLAHVLLTEYTPFGNGTEKNLQTETNILSVREKEFKCIEDYFEPISVEAQDFIENLLQFRPKHRLTVEEALNHEWFKKNLTSLNKNAHNSPLIECADCNNIVETNVNNVKNSKLINNENFTDLKNLKLDSINSHNPHSHMPTSVITSSSSAATSISTSLLKNNNNLIETKEERSTKTFSSELLSPASINRELKLEMVSSLSSSSTSSTSSIENNSQSLHIHENIKKPNEFDADLLNENLISFEAISSINNNKNNKSTMTKSTLEHLITSTTNFKLETASSSSSSSSRSILMSNSNNEIICSSSSSSNGTSEETKPTSVLASRLLNIAELATQF